MPLESLTALDLVKPVIMAIHEDTPLRDIARIFSAQRISGAPVVDAHERLVGVVSLRDLARGARAVAGAPAGIDEFYGGADAAPAPAPQKGTGRTPARQTAGDVMTRKIHSVPAAAPLAHVAGLMVERRIHRVLVESRGRLAGILTSTDLLTALAGARTPRRG